MTRVIGLMSGTSVDGIDAALVDIFGKDLDIKIELVAGETYPYPTEIRKRILEVCAGKAISMLELAELDDAIASCFAEAAIEILQPLFRSETDPETQALALLQAAEIHTDLARPEEAQALLRLIREDTSPSIQRRLRFLEAKTALLMGDPETAVLRASDLLTSLRQKDRNLANRTVFLLAEASAEA